MKNLADYIMAFDDCLPTSLCNSLITKFNSCQNLIPRNESWSKDYRAFDEINLTGNPIFKSEQDQFYAITNKIYDYYIKTLNIQFMPSKIGYEEVRMKRYINNKYDQFGWHTDVNDYKSARRFLVMFYYLNDVEEGGETIFSTDLGDIQFKPKAGRILIFPPLWLYPHKGMQPISNPKYIVSTYCHYL